MKNLKKHILQYAWLCSFQYYLQHMSMEQTDRFRLYEMGKTRVLKIREFNSCFNEFLFFMSDAMLYLLSFMAMNISFGLISQIGYILPLYCCYICVRFGFALIRLNFYLLWTQVDALFAAILQNCMSEWQMKCIARSVDRIERQVPQNAHTHTHTKRSSKTRNKRMKKAKFCCTLPFERRSRLHIANMKHDNILS